MNTFQAIATIAILTSCGSLAAGEGDAKVLKYMRVMKPNEATLSLTAKCTLAGVIEDRIDTNYFRPRRDNEGGGGASGSLCCGLDGDYTDYSVNATPKTDHVDLTIRISWQRSGTTGLNEVTVPVRYSEDMKGSVAGLTYDLTWKQLK